ncbi:MAG: hypothetical protein MJY83_02350 [Bacteroidales bacterium]|nr:hypothetical protein [Bacteroidales bacterium]
MNREIIKLLSVFACFLASVQYASSQNHDEYEAYTSAAREQSMLFRGRQATSYAHLHYNGTYFWQGPDFKEGTVMYNGKLYTGIQMNIDASEHQLLVRYASGMPSVIVSRDYVTYFTIGTDRFINASALGLSDDKACLMQVLSDGEHKVYYRVLKVFSSSSNNVNGSMIGYSDPNYNEGYTKFFHLREQYYTEENGALKKISRRKAFKLMAYGK